MAHYKPPIYDGDHFAPISSRGNMKILVLLKNSTVALLAEHFPSIEHWTHTLNEDECLLSMDLPILLHILSQARPADTRLDDTITRICR
jgi:hypothetical protein